MSRDQKIKIFGPDFYLQGPLQWVLEGLLDLSEPIHPGSCSALTPVPNDGKHCPGSAAPFCPQLLLFLKYI